MEIIGYILFLCIGIVLGLIGGGGSVLAVPVLVYLYSFHADVATAYSLFIVGTTSFVGSFNYLKKGNLSLEALFLFAFPSLITTYVVRKFFMPSLPDIVFSISSFAISKDFLILFIFSLLLILSSSLMIFQNKPSHKNEVMWEEFSRSPLKIPVVALLGGMIGFLTGFVGVGGGFMIVPALVIVLRISMKNAIGTSLSIIALNSVIGFFGSQGSFIMDWKLLILFSLLSVSGIFVGLYLSDYISGKKLKPAFGWFTFFVGVFIIIKETIIK
jgi:hypothetical protein